MGLSWYIVPLSHLRVDALHRQNASRSFIVLISPGVQPIGRDPIIEPAPQSPGSPYGCVVGAGTIGVTVACPCCPTLAAS